MTAKVIAPIVLAVCVAVCLFALTSGNFALLVLGGFVPMVALCIGRPDLLLIGICWTYSSTLRIPGLPGEIQLHQLLMAGFIVIAIARYVLTRRGLALSWAHRWAVAFGIILAVTMYVRGSGFRVLGEALWGGARYVDIILGLLFFLTAQCVQLSSTQWKWAIVGLLLSGALPALAELLYVFSGGSVYWQYAIFLPKGGTGTALESMETGATTRFTMLSRLSQIYLIPFIFCSVRRRRWLLYAVFILIGFLFGGFTGHRIVLLHMVLFIWMFFFLQTKRKVVFFVLSASITVLLLFGMGQIAFLLPSSFQRMLTLVPFANVSFEVMADASGSIDWRMQLWREAVKLIPQYLWVGKGYAYSPILAQAHDVRWLSDYAIWWALVQTAYHQGVLSLLIGMGLPGLFTGLLFLATICGRHYRPSLQQPAESVLQRIYYVYFVSLLVSSLSFVAVYGDVFVSFPKIFFYAAILEGVGCSLSKEEDIGLAAPA